MYRKMRKNPPGKKKLLSVIVLFNFFLIFIIVGCSDQKIVFNREKWIEANKYATWDIRQKMAQDLIDHQTLIGKTKKEMVELLGAPEEYSDASKNDLYYTIDLYYGTDIDPVRIEYLVISIDSNDKVKKYVRHIALDNT